MEYRGAAHGCGAWYSVAGGTYLGDVTGPIANTIPSTRALCPRHGHLHSSRGRGGQLGGGGIFGSGREVWLSDVGAGETVSARTKLINIGAKPSVYRNSAALSDLRWLIGFLVFGIRL